MLTDNSPPVCFCTEKNENQVKEYIRQNMKPSDTVTNDLLCAVHKSFTEGLFVGRCCGCMDEVEELMVHYTQKVWS